MRFSEVKERGRERNIIERGFQFRDGFSEAEEIANLKFELASGKTTYLAFMSLV